ncbi:hypothetical protein GH714_015524 [Hevea brasiliensis]|uniref:Uncharacterized protein n=1 Tax=Hevea brasiliensis TaxID=3981 RepID=A0A6A6LDQ3_HEVBR|nr:hypothetical protein GH714_015524 [Hevea brasiliensis]
MPAARHFARIGTLELKLQIEKKLGHLKAQKTPPPKESKAKGALSVKVPNGYQKSSLQSLCRDFLQSPCKGRSVLSERKFRDRPSPLGPHGKSHTIAFEDSIPKNQEQSTTELLSLVSKPPGSVEDGEEVDQAAGSPSIYSRSPVRAPLGIPLNSKGARKVLCNRLASSYHMGTCQNSGELPDSNSLRKRLEQKLEMEGIKVSVDCADLLNNSLDVYLKRLIKPCMGLAGSRSGGKHTSQGQICSISGLNGVWPVRYFQKPSRSIAVSMLDFQLAMELNPQILGEDWPMQLERFLFRASEE